MSGSTDVPALDPKIFQRELWIGHRHVYATVPKAVKAQCIEELSIPTQFSHLLHPDATTVSMLLERQGIPEIGVLTPSIQPENLFFCGKAQAITDKLLLQGPLLPIAYLRSLAVQARQAWLDDQLLLDPRIVLNTKKPTRTHMQALAASNLLPLWVPGLWLALYPLSEAQSCWKRVDPWLSAITARHNPLLSSIDLVDYLGDNLLRNAHLDDIALLFRRRQEFSGQESRTLIETTLFSFTLTRLAAKTAPPYATAPSTASSLLIIFPISGIGQLPPSL